MNSKYLRILTVFFIIIITFTSCSQKILGYGTILWAPEDSLFSTGQTVTIISESELADVYLLNDGSSEEPVQMERWRVEFFEDAALADKRSKGILEYKTIFARNLKDGLLIREEPSINSPRVYKMRKNQIIKIFDRTADISAVGQYEGYWYQVITEDGTRGYCFDHYLDIYDSSVKPEEKVDPAELLIETAFDKSYHPSSFIDMIKDAAIDLKLFKPQIGLFPDLENRSLRIVNNGYSINVDWDSLTLIDKRSFELGETGVEVTVLSDTRLQVIYYYEGEKVIINYVVIENIEDIIIAETERRETLYNSLLETGTSFSSNAYGNIRMQFDGSFTWTDYDRLIPQIIPDGSDGTGKIRFDKFLSSDMKDEYTGIMSFNFKYGDNFIPINFLYTLVDKKLRLTYVPENDITKNIVRKKSISPIVIAFSAD